MSRRQVLAACLNPWNQGADSARCLMPAISLGALFQSRCSQLSLSLSLSVHVYVYFTYQIRTERRPKSVRFYVSVHCGRTCIHIGVYIALGFHALRVIAYTPTHPATFTHSHAFHIYILTHPPLHLSLIHI